MRSSTLSGAQAADYKKNSISGVDDAVERDYFSPPLLAGGHGGKARWRADGAGHPRFFDIGVEENAEKLKS